MRKQSVILLLALAAVAGACAPQRPEMPEASAIPPTEEGLVVVAGGNFVNAKSSFFGKNVVLPDFVIGQYEVTQKEWQALMGSNPSTFVGEGLPVESVSWYDAVAYCNKRSEAEGLQPYYTIDKLTKDPENVSELDTLKWKVTLNAGADGYRLPTEAEWEYAASGGRMSKSYLYSGGNEAEPVAWYWRNAGKQLLAGGWDWTIIENNRSQTRPVGGKLHNELGLYDMSGNVREWCWDWYTGEDNAGGTYRVVKGGGWVGDVGSQATAFRGKYEANGRAADQGFRVVRSKQ